MKSTRTPLHVSGRLAAPLALAIALAGVGCGGGGNNDNPTPPDAIIDVIEQILDVGERYFLDGSRSKRLVTDDVPAAEDELDFSWRIVDTGLPVSFDDYCADDPLDAEGNGSICDENADDTCGNDDTITCNSDEDCQATDAFGFCDFNSGTTSPDCATSICLLFNGDQNTSASFLATHAGPYDVRLTAVSSQASDIGTIRLLTYPSLYVVGSLVEFGGTRGGEVGAVADAVTFTPDATKGAASPLTGNLVIVDPVLGVVREFDLFTHEVLGGFGDSDRVLNSPVAVAFDEGGDLWVIEDDGTLRRFSGGSGLVIKRIDTGVAGAVSIEANAAGDVLIATGVDHAGIRRFSSGGSDLGVLGDTAAAIGEAVDMAFMDGFLLVADATGDVVRCDADGTDCSSFGSVGGMLAAGSPSAVAVNPSAEHTDAHVLVADPVEGRVLACSGSGNGCAVFGDASDEDSASLAGSAMTDIFFAPTVTPETTTTTSTTTTTTLAN